MPEPGSDELRVFLESWPQLVTSVLADVELHRACARHPSAPALFDEVQAVLARVSLVDVSELVVVAARDVAPPELRSIDAVHLASALSLEERLGVFVCYDRRLLGAALEAGVPTASPA